MSEDAAEFTIGAHVSCDDGVCGELTRVVVDPVGRVLTHLVVEPRHQPGFGRLVPVDLVDAAEGRIHLCCSARQFDQLQEAEETHFVHLRGGEWGYGADQTLSWPYYELGMGGMGMQAVGDAPDSAVYERVPLGEVQVRRGDRVHARDGCIGSVQGLVIDPRDHHVTHVLLQEGHLLGRKRVAIPIGVVTGVGHGIDVDLTKRQLHELPPVEVSRHS